MNKPTLDKVRDYFYGRCNDGEEVRIQQWFADNGNSSEADRLLGALLDEVRSENPALAQAAFEEFRRVTGMDVRVASAETGIAEESKEKTADPAYATAVGILLKGAEQGACAFVERPAARPAEQQGFRPPQPQPAPEFRHTPRFQQPVQAPPAAPAAEEAEEDAAASGGEETPVIESKRKRNWSSIFQKTFDKINSSFTAAEDEEI